MDSLFALLDALKDVLSSAVGLGSSIATGNPIGIGSSALDLGSSAIQLSGVGSSVLNPGDAVDAATTVVE